MGAGAEAETEAETEAEAEAEAGEYLAAAAAKASAAAAANFLRGAGDRLAGAQAAAVNEASRRANVAAAADAHLVGRCRLTL